MVFVYVVCLFEFVNAECIASGDVFMAYVGLCLYCWWLGSFLPCLSVLLSTYTNSGSSPALQLGQTNPSMNLAGKKMANGKN